MKKILFVVHSFGIGGVETVLTNIANALSKRGYDITICVTSNNLGGTHGLVPEIKLKHKDEPQFRLFKKLPYIRNFYESGMWSRCKSPEKLYKYFVGTKEKFDVEIAFFFGRPLKTVYGSNNRGSKKILFIHSDYKQINNGAFMGFKTRAEALSAYNFFDKIACVSIGVKRSFEHTIKTTKEINVIYNLNDNQKIKTLSKSQINTEGRNLFTFVCVGRLSKEKGFIRVVESAKKLNENGFKFDVWLIGDGPERKTLADYIKNNGLENVKLFGSMSNPYPYIIKADILVCPSESEAYGLSVSEAFILEKPVLVTDCVGPRELVADGEYGILVDNSSDAVYAGMKRVLQDKEWFNYYCQKAAERSRFFDSDKILNDIEKLINE